MPHASGDGTPAGGGTWCPDDLEHLADEAGRGPVGEADAATGPAHPEHLGRGPLGVGHEHDPERGQHGVEGVVVEGQGLGVGDLGRDGQALGLGRDGPSRRGAPRRSRWPSPQPPRRAAASEALPLPAATSSTCDPAAMSTASQSVLADDLQGGADHGVVAAGPGGLLAALDGVEVVTGEDVESLASLLERELATAEGHQPFERAGFGGCFGLGRRTCRRRASRAAAARGRRRPPRPTSSSRGLVGLAGGGGQVPAVDEAVEDDVAGERRRRAPRRTGPR